VIVRETDALKIVMDIPSDISHSPLKDEPACAVAVDFPGREETSFRTA
jgi:hypothetical protein